MIILLFLFALLFVWLVVVLIEDYGYIFSEIWHKVWANVLPQNAGARRLCIVTGVFLAATTFLELPKSSRFRDIIAETEIQTPDWIVPVIIFCIPFIVAKVIEFIVEGFRK